jgi:TolA-binding protein
MNSKAIVIVGPAFALVLLASIALAQTVSNAPPVAPAVSYASVSQLNGMLTQLEQASQAAQGDLAKLRIERWKTDANSKKQSEADVQSLQRNLQGALPAIIAELRTSPESLPSTFKLYRNLDALYDVMGSVVESAGAFGSKDEFQALENDLSTVEKSRRTFADRTAALAETKEAEVTRLRAQVQAAQTVVNSAPPTKTIVDDTAPEPPKKKIVKKKPVSKPPASGATGSTTPATSTPTQAPKQ